MVNLHPRRERDHFITRLSKFEAAGATSPPFTATEIAMDTTILLNTFNGIRLTAMNL